jgi:hypothetical protein
MPTKSWIMTKEQLDAHRKQRLALEALEIKERMTWKLRAKRTEKARARLKEIREGL